MSKISLEPNDSGAGTFTLAAPNSNTNRTLTLPDEAGKLLSTGNDDPAEVFKQSNILGTVSESGGVPTGAVIESDSNSDGEYTRWADGTQIAGTQIELPGSANTADNFASPWPVPFINTDAYEGNRMCSWVGFSSTSSGTRARALGDVHSISTPVNGEVQVGGNADFANPTVCQAGAYGRWFE